MDNKLLLPSLVLLPLVLGLLLATLPRGKDAVVKKLAFLWTLVVFALSLVAAFRFDWQQTDHTQLQANIPWVPQFGLNFGFGVDSLSLWLVLLTTFLMPILVLGSFSAVKERTKEFFLWLLVLEAAMIGTFVATDLIFFYICFEFTLIPLYFLIGIFGSTQRLKAARVFFLYTFTGSMLTFAGLLFVAWQASKMYVGDLPLDVRSAYPQLGSWTFDIRTLTYVAQSMTASQQMWVLLALLAGFAVKVPLFPVHTWLPLAHTEAPTAGSVILAGVLLKLGTYGILRFALPMTPDAIITAAPYIGTFAVIGILYTALICWVQKDIKKLVAYSSVSHLGFCVLGMLALNPEGMGGSVLYMINHGLSTGALFLCIGMIYERFHTREMSQMSGLARVMPVWATFMIFFTLASVGLPGLNGFVSEFLALLGTFLSKHTLGPKFAAVAGVGMIFGAIYLLYMLGRVVWGPLKVPAHHGDDSRADASHGDHGHTPHVSDLNLREILTLVPLAVACLWLGLFPTPMLKSLEAPLAKIEAAATSRVRATEVRTADSDDNAGTQIIVLTASGTPVAPGLSRDSTSPRAFTNDELSDAKRGAKTWESLTPGSSTEALR